MIFKRSLRLVLLAAIFWCCCSTSFAQTQNTYLLNLTNDHYSVIENPASPGQFVHAGTVASTVTAGTHDIHAFELDAAGNILWEMIYQTSGDERAFHVDVSPVGFIISGYVDNGAGPHALLMEIAPGGAIVNQAAYPDTFLGAFAFGLHVQATVNDPNPGYIMAGLVSTGFNDFDAKAAMLLKVDAALTPQWVNYYDSPSLNNDYDMGSHVIEAHGGMTSGYFLSGSTNRSNGDQQVLGVMVNYGGVWQWDTEYTDNNGNGHYSVGAGAIYDAATNQIHQLCNLSIIHHWGVTTYDAASGIRNLGQSFRVFSSLGYANIMGWRIMQSPDQNNLIIAGLMRDHFWNELDENGNQTGNTFTGSPPWMCEVDKNGTTFLWDELYQVPSANFNVSVDFFSAFSAGQQARILQPEMAIRKLDGQGYWLNAYNNNGSGLYDLEVIETDLLGRNGCSSEPLGLTFATNGFFDEDNNQPDPSSMPMAISTITGSPYNATILTCSSPNPCTADAQFSITDLGDCCYQFDDLTPDPASPCSDWEIFDPLGNLIAGGAGPSFVFCFPASGTYEICYIDCCVNPDGTISTTQVCQFLDVECGCIPDADFQITDIGDCCYVFDDLTPDPNSPCSDWIIFDSLGNPIAGGAGNSFTFCFPASGTYQICYTDCCVNPDGTVVTTQSCQLLDVECDCIPDAEFIIDDIGDCCYQFSAINPDPNSPCNDWTVLDAFGNIIAGGAGTTFIHCFTTSGTYQVCFTTCCVNPDGTVTTAQTCQLLDVVCDCIPDANFSITDIGDCCYVFDDLTPDPNSPCSEWLILDALGNPIAGGPGTSFTFCFPASGTYQICYTDCCVNPDGTVVTTQSCQLLDVECDCIPDAEFIIDDIGDCCYQFTAINPDPNSPCNDWTVLDAFGNIIAGGAGTTFIHCFTTSGTYQVCFTTCCVNPDGTVTTAQTCQLLDVVCDCIPDADFQITDIGDCCYVFDDLTPDPNSPCSEWLILDALGNPIAGGPGTSFTFCFPTSGTYQICYTDCCVNPDGTIVTTQACQLLDVECDCVPDAEFIIDDIGDCCYQFSAINPDPNSPCNDWTILDAGGNIIAGGAGTTFIHCFTTSGTYQVCFTTCCVNPDGTVTTAQTCQLLDVDCGCQVPTDVDFDWVYSTFPCDQGCAIGFNCPMPLLDPAIYCVTWDFGDGTVINGAVDVCPIHCYDDCGLYTVCMTVYCCDDPNQSITVCHEVLVDCCCEVEPFDFQWGPAANPLCVDGCSIGFNCPVLDPDQFCVSWDFGDGTPPYTIANSCPIHCYADCGIYTVCLTVYCCDDPSQSLTVCHEVIVDCCCDVDPFFVADPIGDCCYAFFDPTPSTFTDPVNNCDIYEVFDMNGNLIANGVGDYWEYCFPTSGSYVICHTDCCENPDGTITEETYCMTLDVDCPCDVPADLDIVAVSDDDCEWGFCVVGDIDPSQHCVTWDWGDGTIENHPIDFCPIHQYLCDGTYTVCATVYCCDDPSISTTVCTTIVVDCPCQLPAGQLSIDIDECTINGSVIHGLPGLCPDEICYSWDFGDGTVVSGGQNQSHTYNGSGTYTVCVTYFCCDDPTDPGVTLCQEVTVECGDCPEPCELHPRFVWMTDPFTFEQGCCVHFTDVSVAGTYTTITSYHWDFGDGNTSNLQNPTHCFTDDNMSHTVCLTLTGVSPEGTCTETFCWEVHCGCEDTCPGDLNGDGVVNTQDLLFFLVFFNTVCP